MHKLQHSTQLNQMTTNNQLDGAAGIGAPLYVPATRHDLANICNGTKFPFVRSVILCLEDAIHKNDLPLALENISSLCSSKIQPKCQIFVRVANPEILATVCNFPGSEKISGFVLPKITAGNFRDYTSSIPQSSQYALMPTLETREVFSPEQMTHLRDELLACHLEILCLRIGGNDLLNCLGIRRPTGATIYQTPLALVIHQLITTFRPHDFLLSAPVYDNISCVSTLKAEAGIDAGNGLVCKAAVHPTQVTEIELQYRVTAEEADLAAKILKPDAPAVFGCQGQMCEPSTQLRWAESIQTRQKNYGLVSEKNAADS